LLTQMDWFSSFSFFRYALSASGQYQTIKQTKMQQQHATAQLSFTHRVNRLVQVKLHDTFLSSSRVTRPLQQELALLDIDDADTRLWPLVSANPFLPLLCICETSCLIIKINFITCLQVQTLF
jgi:hypothetical protein